jgi:hypothetical protein
MATESLPFLFSAVPTHVVGCDQEGRGQGVRRS